MRGVDYPSRVDLPAVVSSLIAEIDGHTPAPWVTAGLLSPQNPSPVYLTPDRRAEASVLVSLWATPGTQSGAAGLWGEVARFGLSITVGGEELVEGVVPVGALVAGESPVLPAPVVQSPSTPMVVRASQLFAPVGNRGVLVQAAYLGCSMAAARVIEGELGRARWWGLGWTPGPSGSDGYLNVDRGGRVLWAAGVAVDDTQSAEEAVTSGAAEVKRNGRDMGQFGLRVDGSVSAPMAELAHEIARGDVYATHVYASIGGPGYVWLAGAERRC